MADRVADLLRQGGYLTRSVQADAWDAFHASETPEDLAPLLKRLPLPQGVRAALWDLKHEEYDQAMLPRETKLGRGGAELPAREPAAIADPHKGPVTAYLRDTLKHYNAGTLMRAAIAYKKHIDQGGQMMLALAGGASTGEIGRSLAPMIRAGKIHAISTTAANLEESAFLLVGQPAYQSHPDYHEHTPAKDAQLGEGGMPRVTDVSIPEQEAMTPVTDVFRQYCQEADAKGLAFFPHEYFYRMIREKALTYQTDPAQSWLIAAAEQQVPIFTPGFEDSTTGNIVAADAVLERYRPSVIRSGLEAMMALATWYRTTVKTHPLGYLQLGGGIAGDFAICVVPLLIADLKESDTPKWSYFAQLTDADESMGGYSGALPTEKSSWLKLDPDTPAFNIKGDFTINFPLLAAIVLGL